MKHPDPRIEELLSRLVSSKLAMIDLSLDRINALLAEMGNPQDKLPPVVHVAGTNGKGSLVAYLTAVLQAAGYRVHRYTSPHLVYFNERIVLAGKEIDNDYLLKLLTTLTPRIEHAPVTYFEATTAIAFQAFAEIPADIVLLETGLGGRLDATNVIKSPALTSITPVSMDHMDYLGDSLAGIAAEKAGIIKPLVPCVTGPQLAVTETVIAEAAHRLRAPLYRYGHEWHTKAQSSGFHYRSERRDAHFPMPNLAGAHQINNAATAIACLDLLPDFTVTQEQINTGITHAYWPARLQHLTEGSLVSLMPKGSELWLDGGHNPGAGEVLAAWLKQQEKRVHIICGMLKTKDTEEFLKPITPYAASLTAIPIENEPQSRRQDEIVAAAKASGMAETRTMSDIHIKSAMENIVKKEKKEFKILICGSLSLAGNILWQNSQRL